MNQAEEMLIRTADEIDEIVERLSEIADWAEDENYPAVANRIAEGRGRIMGAAESCRQYADGTLPIRQD